MTPAKPLRGAVIGFGIAGEGHGTEYLRRSSEIQDVEIIAVADVSPERCQLAQARFPNAQVYNDADILLERERKHLDFVDICTPPSEHAPLALKALRMGLHVICESPIGTTAEDAIILQERAEKENKLLFPYIPLRYSPVFCMAREVFESRLIGKLRSINIEVFAEGTPSGTPEWKPQWRDDVRAAGGLLLEDGVSCLYLALDLFNTLPQHVSSKLTSTSQKAESLPDIFYSSLTFPNGIAHVQVNWRAGIRKFFATLHGEGGALTIHDDRLEISVLQKVHRGEAGAFDLNWTTEKRIAPSRFEEKGHATWFQNALERFITNVREKKHDGKEALNSRRATSLALQCARSAKEACREIYLEPGVL